MNPNDPIRFLKRLASITLADSSRTRIRAALSAYADLHAVPEAAPAPVGSSLFGAFLAQSRGLYGGALALVLVVALGGQATFAAEDTVPGDILYPMKVVVSERMALALAPTERRATLSAEFASRRVEEAAALEAAGKLDEKAADELATRFEGHVDAVTEETKALEEKGEIAVSLAVRTDLESKLAATVEGIAASSSTSSVAMKASVSADEAEKKPAGKFAERVAVKAEALATTRESLETALELDADADLSAVREEREGKEDAEDPEQLFTAEEPKESGEDEDRDEDTATSTDSGADDDGETEEPAGAVESATRSLLAPLLDRR